MDLTTEVDTVITENRDGFGCLLPNKTATAVCRRSSDGGIVYNVQYNTDSFCRRIAPVEGGTHRDHFIAFFGCSYCFGVGVNDAETLPSRVGQLAPNYTPYNYGVGGYGPQQMLFRLQHGNLRPEIGEATGIAVYVYLLDHMDRLIGGMPVFNFWVANFPYYYLKGGQIVYGGTFREGRPVTNWIYDQLWNSGISKAVPPLSFPLVYNRSHYELLAAVFTESARLIQQQIPGTEFYVLFYNGAPRPVHRVIACLEKHGIKYIDATPSIPEDETLRDYYLLDGHPTPKSHMLEAQYLVKALGIGAAP